MEPSERGLSEHHNRMQSLLTGIEWQQSNHMMDNLMSAAADWVLSPLSPGLEADVVKVTAGREQYVLKVWNRQSRPDVMRQFRLLQALHQRGIRVSEPVACGRTAAGDGALLTRYHGNTVSKVNPGIFKKIAAVMADIHRQSPDQLGDDLAAKYDFERYFFPGIEGYPAVHEELRRLIAIADMKNDRLIHGDFNLGNILEDNGQYTVIDWTNGQLGDPRYDLAWACLLLRIYMSESKSLTFQYKYEEEMPGTTEGLDIFEALACLRWLLLDRLAGLPKQPDTMSKIRKIVKNNRFLDEQAIL